METVPIDFWVKLSFTFIFPIIATLIVLYCNDG